MPATRIYMDTSVLGGAFDDEFKVATATLLNLIRSGGLQAVVSELVEAELQAAPREVQLLLNELYALGAERLEANIEAQELAATYVKSEIVSPKYLADATHIALATLAKVDVLVSWNFKHIVNFRRIRGFNGVNLLQGYGTLEIRSPREVTSD